MRTALIFAAVCLVGGTALAERRQTNAPPLATPESAGSRRAASVRGKGLAATTPDDLKLPQAPGVLQLHPLDSNRVAYFVATETIPKDTVFRVQIYPPIDLGKPMEFPSYATEDIAAGSDYLLPMISAFGSFRPSGYYTYNVVVEPPGGTRTHSAAEFRINRDQPFEDVLSPVIYSMTEQIVNREVILVIGGVFESDSVYVAIDNYTAPASAITRPASDQIRVNLNKVPGFPLDIRGDYLVTVGQIGWTDTRVLSHVPHPPSLYNRP